MVGAVGPGCVCVGKLVWKMSASWRMAFNFSSPNCKNGDAGAGVFSISMRSMMHCVALSREEVVDIQRR